ncbi:SWIM zinc finger family protein [Prescottella sp. R16]|uniref:SWIM zinc finger family protein n=1 Tax=Prescottella sp. R16 TaxID=3064529 RepID=UPI00272E73CC|nr:SWIM zinc finger family protein [Prescottella sp. R16]
MTGFRTGSPRSGWGRALLDVLDRVGDPGRIARGRTYARGGRVLALDVAAGRVVADVQGSQLAPFTATLTLRTLDAAHTAELLDTVRSTPGALAALVSGTVPQALAPMLLPDGARELDFDCTCPDSGWPCRHVAALAHVLTEHVDRDPTTLLVLRGIDLDTVIREIGGSPNEAADPDNAAGDAVDAGDHFGDDARYEYLPEVPFTAAPDDLDAALLRAVLRTDAEGEPEVIAALRDLDECYRALGSGFRRR